ncbi:hypothetical protein QOZ80_1BG0093310 [Eleusine coracana subsp. coracana]|nr:hypothetical protein QOZ80_1BG0093310 [Eleusine coracana subsp. coracana]
MSILRRIGALGEMVAGVNVCPGEGYFEVILHRYPGNNNDGRRVRLRFNYPNLYLQGFKTHGVWYRLRDQHPVIVPANAPPHRYVVEELPFESGYTNGGLEVDFGTLTFGRSVFMDIYVTLRDFPNNAGGMEALKRDLAKTCVLFPEAPRYPRVRRLFVFSLKQIERVTVVDHRWMFTDWRVLCRAIRDGPDSFVPIIIEGNRLDTYEQLRSSVSCILFI